MFCSVKIDRHCVRYKVKNKSKYLLNSWKELTERDCREWKLYNSSPHDRKKWRHWVKSAMHAASQSSRREPTSVDSASEPAR